MDSVTFTFKIEPTPSRLDTVYPSRRPNYHVPAGRDVTLLLKPRETAGIMEVDKLDLTREFQPHPFNWVFEALPETPTATEGAATAPPPAVAVAAAAGEAIPATVLPTALTASDLLEKQAQLEGDLGEAARVALKLEQEEAAEAQAAAIAAAKRAEEDELSQAVAATASSLPVIPYEVVSKVKADGISSSSEGKVGDAGADDAGRRAGDEAEFWAVRAEAGPRVEDEEHGETVLFSHERSGSADGGGSTSAGETAAVQDADTADGSHPEDDSSDHRVNI